METKYNLKSPGVKRLMREAMELAEPTEDYYANPLEDNLFEWHFTVRGPPSTEFEGGYYHGRILLPTQYPMQPPNIILLTPNGRFEVNKKICLSISGHHPESWQPSWSIRTALLALIAFMPTPPAGTIGSLDYTPDERKTLAKKSLNWECPTCGNISSKLLTAPPTSTLTQEETSMIKNIALKAEEEASKKLNNDCKKELIGNEDNNASSGEAVRRRNVDKSSEASVSLPTPADSLLRASTRSTARPSQSVTTPEPVVQNRPIGDDLWLTAIWLIIAVIILLLIRRFYFI